MNQNGQSGASGETVLRHVVKGEFKIIYPGKRGKNEIFRTFARNLK